MTGEVGDKLPCSKQIVQTAKLLVCHKLQVLVLGVRGTNALEDLQPLCREASRLMDLVPEPTVCAVDRAVVVTMGTILEHIVYIYIYIYMVVLCHR